MGAVPHTTTVLLILSVLSCLANSSTITSTLAGNWCTHSGAVIKSGDFDGDGLDDVMCYDNAGSHWIRYSKIFKQDEALSGMAKWCSHGGAKRYIGDFNGDNRDDLLCHDTSGNFWIALANVEGLLSGTSWSKNLNWCSHSSGRLLVGDFNGDGRSDVLCHDTANGRKWVSICAHGGTYFEHGTNYENAMNWCSHAGSEVHVGDFNGDGSDDILCHDSAGQKWIAYANVAAKKFNGFVQSYYTNMGWCYHAGANLSIAFVNKDNYADMICHDNVGSTWTALNNPASRFNIPATPAFAFCAGDVNRFVHGYFLSTNNEQLLCTASSSWQVLADYA